MSTKRRRRVSKKSSVNGLQYAILDIGYPRGHIEPGLGPATKFSSDDHARDCWREVRERIIVDRWTEPHPGRELGIDRMGMPNAFWLYDAPDIDAKRRVGENNRELLERFGITDAQGAIDYPTRRQEAGSARDGS